MNKQARYDQMYLDICERISHMSFAVRAKVGAILVKDDNIISMGWNGMPSGFDNGCEHDSSTHLNVTRPEVLHAESNCISKVAKSSNSSLGATMYITISPCMDCAKLIVQSGVSRVVYKKFYRDKKVLDFLFECGIIIESDGVKNEKIIKRYIK